MSSPSPAQFEANRRNAALSTGPRTPEGKAASAANATRSGLFTTHFSVRPDEAADYEGLRADLLLNLKPIGALEETLALQIVNATWRLRRCDLAESAIPVLQIEPDLIHDFSHPAQKAIERARAAAQNTIRRTTKDLMNLQAERWRRATLTVTGPIPPDELGLAPIKEASADIPTESERTRLMIRHGAIQMQLRMQMQNEANPVRPYPHTSNGFSAVEVDEPNPEEQPSDLPMAA